jgi:hypothetical protein
MKRSEGKIQYSWLSDSNDSDSDLVGFGVTVKIWGDCDFIQNSVISSHVEERKYKRIAVVRLEIPLKRVQRYTH